MNLNDMRNIIRRDLYDEDPVNYRWTDDELNRHIDHAVKDFSEAVPYEQKETMPTTAGSREIDIFTISDRIMLEAVEYPVDKFPRRYQRFSLWADKLTLLGDETPDGSSAYVYYGKLHTLNVSTSTIPSMYEDLIAAGASGYAAVEWAIYAVNKVNVGGISTHEDYLKWGRRKLNQFRQELKRLGRKNKVRVRSFYQPYYPPTSKTTDYGP